MAKGHITRKELKHDAIHDAGQSMLEFFEYHRTRITTVALSVLALILVIVVSSRIVKSNRLAASQGLSNLQKQYMRVQMVGEAETRKEMLDPLVKACESFALANSGSYFGSEALYIKGNCLFVREEYEKAKAAYREYLDAAKSGEDKAKGNIALGYVYENQFFGDRDNKDLLDKALAAYEAGKNQAGGASGVGNYYAAEAAVNIARLHEQTGNYTEAKALYEKIVAGRAFDDEETTEEEDDNAQLSQQESRAKMFRDNLKASTRQFTFKEIAERRLKFIEALQ